MQSLSLTLEHAAYLRDAVDQSVIAQETAQLAIWAWLDCCEATGGLLPIPSACSGPDGRIQYVWDRGEHHLELDFSPSESPSFFYRNRQTGELWGEDYEPGEMTGRVMAALTLFGERPIAEGDALWESVPTSRDLPEQSWEKYD